MKDSAPFMIAIGQKRPGAHGDDDAPDSEGGDDHDAMLESACEDILDAIDKKDPKALASALGHACELCYEQCKRDEEESA